MKAFKFFSLLLVVLLVAVGLRPGMGRSQAASELPVKLVEQLPTDQLIIKYKDTVTAAAELAGPNQATEMERLSSAAGVELAYFRPMSGDAHVLRLPQALPESDVAAIAAKIAALPDVEYAEPDAIMLPMDTTPNDTLYTNQWHYFAPAGDHYGVNGPAAWDVTTGSASIVVAVIDTGITDHPDLAGRWVGGYDFISNIAVANDSDARDADPHDPGDWTISNECGTGWTARNSSWHGTHVAGTIGAATNNNLGVAGINWNSMILPIRVLGKCGGDSSDIADGMRWAAGLAVSGIPNNANPAKVINMSLGGQGACSATYQAAINEVLAAGTSLVISSGNSNADSSGFRPGNCNGVITVAATDRYGSRASYSNYGSVVEISGPGGDQSFANDPDGVLSTLNDGTSTPVYPSTSYVYYQGTSMAAPHVAGVASLLVSQNPTLTPAQVTQILQATVTQFPAGSTCSTSICGTGIVNAFGAVSPIITALSPTSVLTDTGPLQLTVSGANFNPSTTIYFSATARTTYFINSTLLTTTLTLTDTHVVGNFPVLVRGTYGTAGVLSSAPKTFTVGAGSGVKPVYLPLALKAYGAGSSSGWTTIVSEDFEGGFPGVWQLSDRWPGTGEFLWAKSNCKAYAGSYSGWGIGGGAQGSGLGCGSSYPNDADSYMIYGPFNLTGVTAADLSYMLWNYTEYDLSKPYIDGVCRLASTDGLAFSGTCTFGNTNGWTYKSLDLSNVFGLGDLRGQSQVWIAVYFGSDDSVTYPEGGYVDNIVLRKCTSASCPATAASTASYGSEAEYPITITLK